jgi:DNA-binding NarL/FixJ family response regulator
MRMTVKKKSRLGDIGALVRASQSVATKSGTADRRRRLVAMFCAMLGEQLLDGKPATHNGAALPRRQRQTLELLLAGDAEKQIAARLGISKNTVHVYVKSLYKRFGVSSRAELLARWVRR